MSGMGSTRAKAAWKDGTEDAAAVIYRDQIMKDLECQVNTFRLHLEVSGEP